MDKPLLRIPVAIAVLLMLVGCEPSSSQPIATEAVTPELTTLPAALTLVEPTPTDASIPQGKTVVVTSAEDNGLGSLRQTLMEVNSGDTITFDSVVFPPGEPSVITLMSALPPITAEYLKLDASNAGVILDGRLAGEEWTPGIQIESSFNVVEGLQVVNFSGPGLILNSSAQFNLIGGDRSIGLGPIGEGNLFSGSGIGVAIWGSDNAIVGNLIGTDATGLEMFGNSAAGVLIAESASRNFIGPSNSIAFNGTVGGAGVEIQSVSARSNVITANSIHDNSHPGIELNAMRGTEGWPTVPLILAFELSTGFVEGLTCAGCTVEIFSTKGADGDTYEGSVQANQSGGFAFDRGLAFSGPALTATSRSLDGNTSVFAVPTHDPLHSAELQAGNDGQEAIIESRPLGELTGNFIGDPHEAVGLYSQLNCSQELHDWSVHLSELSFTWERVSNDFLDFPTAKAAGAYSRFEINHCLDQIITLLADNDIRVVFTIVYWDEALGFRRAPNYANHDELDAYLEYVRFIVRNFSDRVQYFEVLNEAFHYVDAADYVSLVRKAEQVIHEESPTSRVVAGGEAYLNQPHSRQWLFTLLRSDVMPLVDAINLHPMYGTSPEFADTRQYYYDYPQIIAEIKAEAESHGFTGEYIAEEMIWRTSVNPLQHEPWQYSEPVAVKYYARAIVMNRGLGLWAGIAAEYPSQPHIVQVIRNLGYIMDGAEPLPLSVRIDSEAAEIATYTFILPNGDRLIALWNDGTAVEPDTGMVATLTVPDFSAQEVLGIDVTLGYQQPLFLESSDGDLVISNLMIKDYPIFIRFIP